MKPIFRLAVTAYVILFCSVPSFGQCNNNNFFAPDSLQWVFYRLGTPAYISSIEKHNDTLYVGGDFNFAGRFTGSFMGVDSSNGSLNKFSTWPRVNGYVYHALEDGNGGIIITGQFSRVGDSMRNNIAQINAAGQVTAFNPDVTGGSSRVNEAVLYNGKLYFGGYFQSVGDSSRSAIASVEYPSGAVTKWNPDCKGEVHCLAAVDTIIFAGGSFYKVGDSVRYNLVAIDSSTGRATGWNPWGGTSTSDRVHAILPNLHNNSLYIGGMFNITVGGAFRKRIAAVDMTTGIARSWDPNPTASHVDAFLLLGGKLVVAGSFASIGGQSRRNIAILDTSTALATSWNATWPTGLGSQVIYDLAESNGNIFAAGDFYKSYGDLEYSVTSFNATTGQAKALQQRASNYTSWGETVLAVGGNVFVGGTFGSIDGEFRYLFTGIDLGKNELHTWNPKFSGDIVNSIKIANNKMYVGGAFTQVDGNNRKNLAKFDMAANNALMSWNPFNISGNFTDVRSLLVSGSYVYAAGKFDFTSNGAHVAAARFDVTTGAADSWNPGLYGATSTIYGNALELSGNHLYIAGKFEDASNNAVGMMRYNLSTNAKDYYPVNVNDVRAIKAVNGRIFAGGGFTNISSATRNRLAAYDINSNTLTNWNPNISSGLFVNNIASYKHLLLVSGYYDKIGGVTRTGFAVTDTVNGTVYNFLKPVFSLYPHTSQNDVSFAAVYGDTVYVAGEFYDVSGKKLVSLARFHLDNKPPVIKLTTASDSVCANTTVTVNATTTSGATYQWRKNGSAVGTNSPSYTFTPVDGDSITCEVSISATSGCYLSLQAVSDSIVFKVMPNTTAVANIMLSTDTVCVGDTMFFNMVTNVAGAHFRWKVGGVDTGTDSNQFSYVPTNGDVVSCTVIRDTGTCYVPPYITIDTAVGTRAKITPTVSIVASSNPVPCTNIADTFTATTNVNGGSFLWQVNGTATLSANKTYSYTPADGDTVKCIFIPPLAGCFTDDSVTSNVITMSVVQPPAIVTQPANVGITAGSTAQFTVAATGANLNYQWQANTGSGFADITDGGQYSGTQGNTLTVSNTMLQNNNNQFRCVVTSGICGSTSNAANLSVYNVGVGGIEKNGISIYPNPFDQQVSIQGLKQGDRITLYDVTGRKVAEWKTTGNQPVQVFPTSNIQPGTYTIFVHSADGTAIGNILLQKR